MLKPIIEVFHIKIRDNLFLWHAKSLVHLTIMAHLATIDYGLLTFMSPFIFPTVHCLRRLSIQRKLKQGACCPALKQIDNINKSVITLQDVARLLLLWNFPAVPRRPSNLSSGPGGQHLQSYDTDLYCFAKKLYKDSKNLELILVI